MRVPKVVVLGAAFIDMIFFGVPKMPDADESVYAQELVQQYGGKGFNQALAAARIGADVNLCAAVGDDAHGHDVVEQLEENGLGTSMIKVVPGATTPVCCVFIDDLGSPHFIGSERACRIGLTEEHIESHRSEIESADVLLTTFDYSAPILIKAIEYARHAGVFVISNPAPWTDAVKADALRVLKLADLAVPNMREAASLLDSDLSNGMSEPEAFAKELSARGISRVCVTAGEAGSVLIERDGIIHMPAFKVETPNRVGASDQLCGALSYYWTMTSAHDALRSATAAAALWLARTDKIAMPTALDVSEFLKQPSA